MTQATMLEAAGTAVFSPDQKYRYTLERNFYGTEQRAIFVMLNPSTATAEEDDPTIRRCIGFAKSWGCAGLTVLNLFAYRATDPRELKKVINPFGPENERHIKERCAGRIVVCAWGTNGVYMGQDRRVLTWLHNVGATVSALKITANGHPSHPLYLPKTCTAREWQL